uniref:Prolamin-like domain-containing protein n=1 Tax=Fagus sylvatica TaxID=28930 RepID=A0A2N9HQN1_FAGSY
MATKNMFIVLLVLTSLLANVTSTRDLTLKSGINVPARVEITSGGQSNLSLGCCHVIKTISNKCWPSMLTSIGLKPKQDNVCMVTVMECLSLPASSGSLV